MLVNYIPVVVVFAVAVGFALLLLLVARALGPRRPSLAKDIPYECGMEPLGRPRSRFGVGFYRIAILFIIFDIEAAFFYPWAVRFRELSCEPGKWVDGVCQGSRTFFGLGVMLVFLLVLLLALIYIWRRKALEWD